MTARVYAESGKLVEVATPDDISGDISNIPVATTTTTGVVKVGSNLSVSSDGTLSSPAATATTYGSVKVGSGISFDSYGAMTVPSYTLPAATTTTLGGVKQSAAVADSTATDVATLLANYNSLLAALRAAGILASS